MGLFINYYSTKSANPTQGGTEIKTVPPSILIRDYYYVYFKKKERLSGNTQSFIFGQLWSVFKAILNNLNHYFTLFT